MLARIALRIATIEALKGNTLVGDNVLDSQIGALEVAADGSFRTDQEAPFISIYTDGSKASSGIDLRSLHKSGMTELTIEAGITAAMTQTDPKTGVSTIVGIGLPATDPAMEFLLDCVGRQISTALSDPLNEWAEIWRGLSSGIQAIERKRASDAESGVRIAAHQLVISQDLLPDPMFGVAFADTSIWAKFFAKMTADAHPYLPVLQSLLGSPDDVLNSEAQRRRFGLTLDEARALLIMPVEAAEVAEPDITDPTNEQQEA